MDKHKELKKETEELREKLLELEEFKKEKKEQQRIKQKIRDLKREDTFLYKILNWNK